MSDVLSRLAAIETQLLMQNASDGEATVARMKGDNDAKMFGLDTDAFLSREIEALKAMMHSQNVLLIGVVGAVEYVIDKIGLGTVPITADMKQQISRSIDSMTTAITKATEGDAEGAAEGRRLVAELMNCFAPAGESVDVDDLVDGDEDNDAVADEAYEEFMDADKDMAQKMFDATLTGDDLAGGALAHAANAARERGVDLGAVFKAQRKGASSEDRAKAQTAMAELMAAVSTGTGAGKVDMARIKLIVDEDEDTIIRECVRMTMQMYDEGHLDERAMRQMVAVFSDDQEALVGTGMDDLPIPGKIAAQFVANQSQAGKMFTICINKGNPQEVKEVLMSIFTHSLQAAGYMPSTDDLLGILKDALRSSDEHTVGCGDGGYIPGED